MFYTARLFLHSLIGGVQSLICTPYGASSAGINPRGADALLLLTAAASCLDRSNYSGAFTTYWVGGRFGLSHIIVPLIKNVC